ncbi:lactate utilization protein [Candidatus Daviesbacteria bacterium]|nr:lactate utilization protein [Candidatus Daviesbacteria bacterium]
MDKWNQLASQESIDKTIEHLKANGIDAKFVSSREDAKVEVLSLIPEGAEVMTMTSVTLSEIGLDQEINKEGAKFKAVRDKLYSLDKKTQAQEMNRLGAAPQYALGSVHAITEDGSVLIASNTGSQLPAYAYAALNVIWAVGAQKIVKNTDEGIKRIYEHSLPLESERAKKAYGVPGSSVNKILIINKEVQPQRITLILVNEVLGF